MQLSARGRCGASLVEGIVSLSKKMMAMSVAGAARQNREVALYTARR